MAQIQLSDLEIAAGDEAAMLGALAKWGVFVIPEAVPHQELEGLAVEFEAAIHAEGLDSLTLTPYSSGHCARIRRAASASEFPAITASFGRPWMDSLAKAFFDAPHNFNAEVFAVHDVVGSKHVANDLHFDMQPTLKFFLYLTDTDARNGAFRCVPGSHRESEQERRKFGGRRLKAEERGMTRRPDVPERDQLVMSGAAGSMIVFWTETLHRAGFVSEGERMVLRGHTRRHPRGAFVRLLRMLSKFATY